ncbi:MAG: hypothetical protein NT084_08275 [Bacteroidetes bacterium]|jgi:hypothetical protein|nr:hypothetical protein [Bacteroidota bacterium]
MRRSIIPIIIAFVVLLSAGGIVTYIFFQRERQFVKVEIPPSYLETVDTSRFSVTPILLKRNYPDDSLLVFFPNNQSKSQVFLYDQANYNRLLFGDHHGVPMFLTDQEGLTAIYGRPVINLSRFPVGKYYVHVTACDFGGFLQLNISDSLR